MQRIMSHMHLIYVITAGLIRCVYFSIITGDDEDEAIYSTEDCEFAAKKRKKDHCTNNTQCKAGFSFILGDFCRFSKIV